ncbi:serine hydrolase [Lentilactobacillus sp. Marseille-Q4993]|uniref:serine hydrolase n=1 Tax=Lentilactobacillus sp. Marseille-Q4993 TaxID=3039492 RepID=UPI0024BCE1F7|nr:serine hydrolase [Lentilactobacillus sp. Marseille-Q4993]
MKFGFSSLLSVVVAVLLAGCSSGASKPVDNNHAKESVSVTKKVSKPTPVKVDKSKKLVTKLMKSTIQTAGGKTSVYVGLPRSNKHWQENNQVQRSASVIKLYILMATLAKVKEGKLSLNQPVNISSRDTVGGTGSLSGTGIHSMQLGKLLNLMIKNSDNTATNAMITQLGGVSKLNKAIKKRGFKQTSLKRKMLDYNALNSGRDNETSVADLGKLLTKVSTGKLLGKTYDKLFLNYMRGNANQTKLPARVSQPWVVHNKTGEFPDYGVQNDAAVFTHNSKKIVVVVLSQGSQIQRQTKAMANLGYKLTNSKVLLK